MSRLKNHPPQNAGVRLNLWKPRGSGAVTGGGGRSGGARSVGFPGPLTEVHPQAKRGFFGLQMILPARWLMALLLGSAAGGCTSAQPDRPRAVDPSAREQIRQLIGDGQCKHDADCRTLAIGQKACGGPEAYLAWSTRNTDEQVLVAVAARYAKERRLQLEKPGALASNCALVSDPGAHCVAAGPEAPPTQVDVRPSVDATATPTAPRHCALRPTRGVGGRAAD